MGAELTGNWNSFLERFSPSQQDIYYREEYLKLKNANNDNNKKSYVLYLEAINNVYNWI